MSCLFCDLPKSKGRPTIRFTNLHEAESGTHMCCRRCLPVLHAHLAESGWRLYERTDSSLWFYAHCELRSDMFREFRPSDEWAVVQ